MFGSYYKAVRMHLALRLLLNMIFSGSHGNLKVVHFTIILLKYSQAEEEMPKYIIGWGENNAILIYFPAVAKRPQLKNGKTIILT